ncbi:MAG: response regulator transcription factor [Phycisphaerales bacterium]
MIKVLLVDDEARLCQAWERMLGSTPDVRLVGTLPRADGLGEAVARSEPSIVVIDLMMPGSDPIRAIEELRAERPNVRVVVYSGQRDRETLARAFDAGAWGYIDKLSDPGDLLTVLRRVSAGEVVFPEALGAPEGA